jgi:uncharacterized membrane protein YphA (DoxX/SURF4 family)
MSSVVQQSPATLHRKRLRQRLWPLLLLVVRLGLSAVFLSAAIPKILEPDLFASSIYNYQMMPAMGVNIMAIALPWLELVVGICIGLGLWTRANGLIASILMVVFVIAFASATARGLNISCGCFEVGEGHAASSFLWVLLRDFAFLVAGLLMVRFPDAPAPLHLLRRRG